MLSGKFRFVVLISKITNDEKDIVSDCACFASDGGICTAVAVFRCHLSIGGAIGMTSMATFKVGNVSQRLKRNTVSVTVGYNF